MKGRSPWAFVAQEIQSKEGLACSSSSGISLLCNEFVNSCNHHTTAFVIRSDLSCVTEEQA